MMWEEPLIISACSFGIFQFFSLQTAGTGFVWITY